LPLFFEGKKDISKSCCDLPDFNEFPRPSKPNGCVMRILLLLLLVISFNNISAQRKQRSMKDELERVAILRVALPADSTIKTSTTLPFSRIVVHDVRFDTTHIALYAEASRITIPVFRNFKIDVERGISASFSQYLNQSLPGNENATGEVVCFIKKLRVLRRDTIVENVSSVKTTGQAKLNAEVFFHLGSRYYPAFKIDTIIISQLTLGHHAIGENIREHLLAPALTALREKIRTANWAAIQQRKSFPDSVVVSNYYTSRFDWPVFKDEKLKKGLYRNFDEFRLNQPSILNFSIRHEKNRTVSILDEYGNYINTNNVFGYYDV